MSAKVRAPVRTGLLSGVGRGVLGDTWLGDRGTGSILETGIYKKKEEISNKDSVFYHYNISPQDSLICNFCAMLLPPNSYKKQLNKLI